MARECVRVFSKITRRGVVVGTKTKPQRTKLIFEYLKRFVNFDVPFSYTPPPYRPLNMHNPRKLIFSGHWVIRIAIIPCHSGRVEGKGKTLGASIGKVHQKKKKKEDAAC